MHSSGLQTNPNEYEIRPSTQQSSRQFRISKTQAQLRQKPQSQGGSRNKNTEQSKEKIVRPQTNTSQFVKQKNSFGEWIHPGLQPDLKFAYEHCDTGLAHYTGGLSMGLFSQQDSQISQMRTENRIMFMKSRLPRQIDNHYDQAVHRLPWISSGKEYDSKCDIKYDDSGLAPILKDKITVKITKTKESIEKLDAVGLRVFPEQSQDNMEDGSIVITIEYCANCKFHGGSTRHDEEKYRRVSENLKISINRHFPNVIVFMKPNNYSVKEKNSFTTFIRTRIGACDVQIAAKNHNNQVQKGILHSKLISQCWPNTEIILEKIREYQPITNITVQIYTRDSDFGKLKNLEVSISPFRNPAHDKDPSPEGKQQNLDINKYIYNKSPNKCVPVSTSNKIPHTKIYTEPPILYKFNAQRTTNETVKFNASHKRRLQTSPNELSKFKDELNFKTAKIDENGRAVFVNMPYDIYQVEVAESNQFRKLCKKLSVFQKIDNNEEISEKFRLQPKGTKCEQIYELRVSLCGVNYGGKEVHVRCSVKAGDEWKFEAQTENQGDCNQEFQKFFIKKYNFLELQGLQFQVFDVADNLIGSACTTLGEIVTNQIPVHTEWLIKEGKYAGDILIKSTGNCPLKDSEITFQLKCHFNPQYNNLQNPFIVLRKILGDDLVNVKKISSLKQAVTMDDPASQGTAKWDPEYQFEQIILKFSELANCDDQTLINIEVYDYQQNFKTLQIDEVQTTMKEIREGDKSIKMNACLLTFVQFEEKEKYQFLQYLESGTNFKHLNLIDFTNINKDEQHLHPKQYVKALGQLSEILIPYDQDRRTQAIGVGIDEIIQKKSDGEQEDQWRGFVFLLNKNGHLDIQGSGQEVVDVYKHYLSSKNILKSRQLKGALNSAILNIQSSNNAYSTILIYMDGKPKDFREFQEIFKTLSSLAVSIVFVGMGGDIEFTFVDMQNKLENLEAECQRDFLQFIYITSSDIKGDPKKLASNVLSQIPYQGEQFFEIHKIKPQPPLSEMESYSEIVKLQISVNYLDMGLDGSARNPQVVLFTKNPKTNQQVAKAATEKALNTLSHTFDDLLKLQYKFEQINELTFHVYDLKSGESYENKEPILTCRTTDQTLIGQISKDEQIFGLNSFSKNKDNQAAQLSIRIVRGGNGEQIKKNLSQEEENYADDADFTQEKSLQEPKNQEQEYDAKKQFLTFLQKGFSLSSVIGLSFCNTLPVCDPKSLHFYSEQSKKENDFQKILNSLPSILSNLNPQQCVSVYGYNQKLFNLSGVDNQPNFNGVQNILRAYQKAVLASQIPQIQENVSLVLQKAIDEARISKDCLDQRSSKEIEIDSQKTFTVAYIFINGQSVDTENLKKQLISSQELPLVVFIVNVGRDECQVLKSLYDRRSDFQIANFYYINYNQLRRSDKILNNFTLPLIPQQMTSYYKKYPAGETPVALPSNQSPSQTSQNEKDVSITFYCDDLDYGDIFDVYQKNPENYKWCKCAAFNQDQMRSQEAILHAIYKFQEVQDYMFVLKTKDSGGDYTSRAHSHLSLGQIVRGIRKNEIPFKKKDGNASKIQINNQLAQQDQKDHITMQWNLSILKQVLVVKEEKKGKEPVAVKKESKKAAKKGGKKEEAEVVEEEEPQVEDVINRYLRFYKRVGQTDNFNFILKSDALTKVDGRLHYQVSVKTSMDKLTDKGSPFIKIEVCEQLNQEEEKVVGTSIIEFQKLQQGTSYFKVEGMDALIFMESMVSAVKMNFFEYLMSGMCMNVSVAIDFTGSNRPVNDPSSLHYYDTSQKNQNQYQKAMEHLVSILLDYDDDKRICLNGFGADLAFPNVKGFSNYFNLTGGQENHVFGVKEMMEKYLYALQHLQLSGPTKIAPVINGVIQQALRSVKINNSKMYQISLVLTDGQFIDTEETQDAIIQASKLPMSILIVVIGQLKLSAVKEMRETLLSGVKSAVAREAIQIIRFVDLKEDRRLLGNTLLTDIPRQLEQYYQNNKILPTLKIKLNNCNNFLNNFYKDFQTIFFKFQANFKIIRDCYLTFFVRDQDESWLLIGESERLENHSETFCFTKEVFFYLQFGKKQELKIEVNEREGDKEGKKNNKKFNIIKKEIQLSDFIKQGTVRIDLIDLKLEKKQGKKPEEKKIDDIQEDLKQGIQEPQDSKYGEATIDICNQDQKGFFQFLQRKEQYYLVTGFEIGDQERSKFAQEIVTIFQDSLDIYNKQEEHEHKSKAIEALERAIKYCQINDRHSVICVIVLDQIPDNFEAFKITLQLISDLKLNVYIYGLKGAKDLREVECLDGMCGQKVNFVKQYSADENAQVLAGKVVPSLGYVFN